MDKVCIDCFYYQEVPTWKGILFMCTAPYPSWMDNLTEIRNSYPQCVGPDNLIANRCELYKELEKD